MPTDSDTPSDEDTDAEADPFAGDTRPAGIQGRHCARCGCERPCRIDGDPKTRSIDISCLACGNNWTNYQ